MSRRSWCPVLLLLSLLPLLSQAPAAGLRGPAGALAPFVHLSQTAPSLRSPAGTV